MNERATTATDVNLLPSIPGVLLDLVAACRRIEFDPGEIVAIARRDPGICCRIVSSAGETLADAPGGEGFLERLISAAGPAGIRSVAINAATHQFFSDPAILLRVSASGLWQRSLACALRAQALAQYMEYPSPDEAYLSGLLHVLGPIVQSASAVSSTPAAGAALGAAIVESWGFGSMMSDAIRYQGESVARVLDAHSLVRILNLACRLEGAACRDDDPGYVAAETLLQIPRAPLHDLMTRVHQGSAALFGRIGIAAQDSAPPVAEELQLELAREVRNFAFISAAGREFAGTAVAQVPAVAGRQMALLFGLGRTLVFRFDAGKNLLYAMDDRRAPSFATAWRIGLASGRSLVSETLLQRRPLNSVSGEGPSPPAVVDRQLIRLLGRSGIACIPLLHGGTRIGVIVSGIDPGQLGAFEKRMDLIRDLGELVAAALHRSPCTGPRPGGRR